MHFPASYCREVCTALAALGMTMCGGSHQVQPKEAASWHERTPEHATTTTAALGVTNRQGADPTLALDDGRLAGVLEAIHDGEIRISHMSEGLATAPEVKAFAHEILGVYEARLKQDKTLWSTNGVTPVASRKTGRIDADTQAEVTRLGDLEGVAFDAEYIDFEVRSQDKALDVLDRIIDGTNTELKTELVEGRQEIGENLRHARAIQAKLRGGSDF